MNLLRRIWHDQSGQDMVEYSLLCAALVVIVAGFLPPAVTANVTVIFSKVSSQLNGS